MLVRYWEPTMALLLMYVAFVTTYEIAFVQEKEKLTVDGLFVVNRIVDFGFLSDSDLVSGSGFFNTGSVAGAGSSSC